MGVLLTDRPAIGESNGLVNGLEYHNARTDVLKLDWTAKGLYITRLRLLSDPGFGAWDVSYCHGRIRDEQGNLRDVDVELPFSQLAKRNIRGQIVQFAIKDKVYARGLGILDNISTLC